MAMYDYDLYCEYDYDIIMFFSLLMISMISMISL